MADEIIPPPDERVQSSMVADVEREIQRYFLDHQGEVIAPHEWRDCAVAIIASRTNVTHLLALEEDYARLQLQLLNDTKAARVEARESAFAEMIAMLESFCNAKGLGARDLADVAGVRRAVEIIKKGIA